MTLKTKILTWLSGIVIIVLAAFIFFKFYFVLGEGVKAGELNQIVYKGWIFKTYEGRIIQTGFKGAKNGGGLQSNEFDFSVTDKALAEKLMRCSGKQVELKYKEYNGMLPWRGMRKYIVTDVLSITDSSGNSVTNLPIDAGQGI